MRIYYKQINLIKGTIEEVLREHIHHCSTKKKVINTWIDQKKIQPFEKTFINTEGVLYCSNDLFFKWLELR